MQRAMQVAVLCHQRLNCLHLFQQIVEFQLAPTRSTQFSHGIAPVDHKLTVVAASLRHSVKGQTPQTIKFDGLIITILDFQ